MYNIKINNDNKNNIKLNKSYIDLNKYVNLTYLEVLLSLNIKIPHLCYHSQLPISGNCRLCLGVVGSDRKPTPLCATSIRPNDYVDYNSSRVRRLRENVLELLLINHPTDCPTCDQGGECDLQDYSFNFGNDRSRFTSNYKKTILNKDRGAIVKTIMNRCINCTRCIRFFNEIVGNTLLGVIGRGINSEISSYIDTTFMDSEISGNVIDLCPVGALTSKATAFVSRSWALNKLDSFDALDSVGSSITLHLSGLSIVKVSARTNYNLNITWISDKIRFISEGLYSQRILKPLYKNINGEYVNLTWSEVLYVLKNDLFSYSNNFSFGCYFGELLNNETIFTASKFMDIIGNNNKYSIQDSLFINNDFTSNFVFNSKINSIINSDICLIFGSNIKSELPIINLRLRKQYLATALPIVTFGVRTNLMYPTYVFGFKLKTIIKFIEGRSTFCKILMTKKNPLFLINLNLFKTESIFNLFNYFKTLINKINPLVTKNNFNYIYPDMDLYNKLYLNISSKYKTTDLNKLDCLYLLNVDNKFDNLIKDSKLDNPYIIYQGHHSNKYINYARLILPSKLYLNEKGSFINVEGNILKINEPIDSEGTMAKDNIILLHSVFSTIFNKIKDNFSTILKKDIFTTYNPAINMSSTFKDTLNLYTTIKLKNNIVKNYTINSLVHKFYANDNISLSSKLMATCNKTLIKKFNY